MTTLTKLFAHAQTQSHSLARCLVLSSLLLTGNRTLVAEEPVSSARLAQVRQAQQLVADLQPQLRLAATRLLSESLDRNREIGEHTHWLSVTDVELQRVTAQLSEAEHQPGADSFELAVRLKQQAEELRRHHEQLQTHHRRLTQDHVVRLAESQKSTMPTRSDSQRQALLSLLKSQAGEPTLFNQPIRVEVAKPIEPAPIPASAVAADEQHKALPRTSLTCPPRAQPTQPTCPPRK